MRNIVELALARSASGVSICTLVLLTCQYLYFCTRKASKLSTWQPPSALTTGTRAQPLCVSIFTYLYFCTSKASKPGAPRSLTGVSICTDCVQWYKQVTSVPAAPTPECMRP